MEILGVGPLELIVILLLAMMIFGPDRLPEIGAKLGKGMRAMRRATREFSQEVEQARQAIESPALEITQPFRDIAPAVQAVAHPQDALRKAVLGEFSDATRPSEQAAADPAGAEAIAAASVPGADQAATPTYREILQAAGADLGQTPDAVDPLVSEDGSVQLPLDGLVLEPAGEPAADSGPAPLTEGEEAPAAPGDDGIPPAPPAALAPEGSDASGANGSASAGQAPGAQVPGTQMPGAQTRALAVIEASPAGPLSAPEVTPALPVPPEQPVPSAPERQPGAEE